MGLDIFQGALLSQTVNSSSLHCIFSVTAEPFVQLLPRVATYY